MPYKRIAVHLRKSELACRLDYHHVVKQHRTPEPYTDLLPQNAYFTAPPVLHFSHSSPTSPEMSRNRLVGNEDGKLQTLPSLRSLLDAASHRRSLSLPEYHRTRTAANFTASHDTTVPLDYGRLTPPPRLLSPFDMTNTVQLHKDRKKLPLPQPSTLPATVCLNHHCIEMSSPNPSGPYWRPASSHSSSTSPSPTNTTTTSPPASQDGPLMNNDKCSVQSILNHDGSATI